MGVTIKAKGAFMKKDRINKPQNPDQIDDLIYPSQLIKTPEFAEKLGISTRTFFRRKKHIETFISPIRIGKRSIRYKLSDVLNFIERGGLNAH
jgi:predicted DNA-binding transcriptional regulator AlpA